MQQLAWVMKRADAEDRLPEQVSPPADEQRLPVLPIAGQSVEIRAKAQPGACCTPDSESS